MKKNVPGVALGELMQNFGSSPSAHRLARNTAVNQFSSETDPKYDVKEFGVKSCSAAFMLQHWKLVPACTLKVNVDMPYLQVTSCKSGIWKIEGASILPNV